MVFEIDGYNALKEALQKMCSDFSDELTDGAVFDCKFVANELLSNAIQYGGGGARFKVERVGDKVRISVKSVKDFRPPEQSVCSACTAERGRGLFLVDAFCEERTYSSEEGICVVVKITEKK